MSQPMDMKCQIEPQGDIDSSSGEFWVNNPFEMLSGKHNFSAYEQNKFFLNRPRQPFVDLSFESGTNIDSDSRSAIAADFDRDGDLDLLVGSVGGGPIRLFQNRILTNNHRVRIDLQGTVSNRQGIGARVVAEVSGRLITRDVFPTNGFMGQSPAELILGVGQAERIDRLTVRWPTGQEDVFTDLPVEAVISIVEGEAGHTVHSQEWMPANSPALTTYPHSR